MNSDIDVNFEPLPGYRLIERIGAGGYGEVWRAEAPGGLTKAIKFVFGTQHEKRAVNESRAMDHIRSVRHPFLLSLERIEVVNGRLLVVTELADGSVKDRFDLHRRDGKRGIPRDELLSYLRDAADALDFMSETHSLQHLDIKPENLLLLAGHVKVADFGLVKDMRQSQASLVGGMTPLYAAPEVFRGAPSRHSDQYSLAIVYQEMLTGTLPFIGSSAAELTLHHLNEEPDLSSLTGADRYSVSRALSKAPDHRYATCREFVDSLIRPAKSDEFLEVPAAATPTFSNANGYVDSQVRDTQPALFDAEQTPAWSGDSAPLLLNVPPTECQLLNLPPIDLSICDDRPIPTLVLGIGGTGARVLAHFHTAMRDQWGSASEVPAVQFLLIDTDPSGLSESAPQAAKRFAADEVLTLPLRRPQHYRENSQQLLHWLGRRWLYNIPRSLRTEGLRPLGRLALADHARVTGQRIRGAMVKALEPAALMQSSCTTNQSFRSDALRVIVVSSISGGTGSGMSLDIGYAVRALLQKLGLARTEISGLMLHSTGRDARRSELARVNAYSWMTEFNHYQQSENQYPGDISCGLPGHAAGVPVFDHTYILQLGDNLETAEYEQATQTVATYIRFNTLSPAAAFFDACRASAGDRGGNEKTTGLRSFGMYRKAASPAECSDELAGLISQKVLSAWHGTVRQIAGNSNSSDDMLFIKRLQLDAGGTAANVRSLIETEYGSAPMDFLTGHVSKELGTQAGNVAATLSVVDDIFGLANSNSEHAPQLAGRTPAQIVAPLVEKLCHEVRRWATRHIDDPLYRLGGARNSLTTLLGYLNTAEAELQRIRNAVAIRLRQIRSEALASNDASRSVDEYFEMHLDHITILAAEQVVSSVQSVGKELSDELTGLDREVDQLASSVSRSASSDAAGGDLKALESQINRTDPRTIDVLARAAEIATLVDARLQRDFLDANGGLAKSILHGGRTRAQLISKLFEISRQVVNESFPGHSAHEAAEGDSAVDRELTSALATATPILLEYGGRRRVLAMLPGGAIDSTSASSVSKMLGTDVTVVDSGSANLTICVEADNLSLPHVALQFVERRRDRVEFAGRVHSRTDIDWTPLVAADAPNADVSWNVGVVIQTTDSQAMSKTLVM